MLATYKLYPKKSLMKLQLGFLINNSLVKVNECLTGIMGIGFGSIFRNCL